MTVNNAADDARNLADLFAGMSQTVDRFRTEHFASLMPEQRLDLEDLIQELEDDHDRFTAIAIQETLAAIQDQLNRIADVTSRAATTLKHLQTVGKVISIAAAAADLALAITTGDAGAVADAINSVEQALTPAQN